MDDKSIIFSLRLDYYRAVRCWKCYNLKPSLNICNSLSRRLTSLISTNESNSPAQELVQLKHLIWFLKLKCLADDYYVNESLLLNETDIDSNDEQVRIFSGMSTAQVHTQGSLVEATQVVGHSKLTSTRSKIVTRHRTGVITGRISNLASRQGSSRTISSYRPLTTSLTATQTAFSRTTRPLLKFSTCYLLSKLVFEYLYNAQVVTNKCPDYRQCLEYLNLVQSTAREDLVKLEGRRKDGHHKSLSGLLSVAGDTDERKSLGVFWLISFGTCYFNLRMNKQAEEYFNLAKTINLKYVDSFAWLVKIYLRCNQPAKVLEVCKEGLKHSKNAILYNWMARVQSLNSDLYTANMNLKELLAHSPTNIEALANVGHFAFYSEKLEQSLRCFERIQQLSLNQATNDNDDIMKGSSAELLNNLALANFYCGFYHNAMPLFLKAFLNSPSKEVTSDIWYNVSFIPISFGYKNLAIACLRLALKNNSQNEQALNNIGVLKCGNLINETLHYENMQELWPSTYQKPTLASESELKNHDDHSCLNGAFDEAETYFGTPVESVHGDNFAEPGALADQPEMLYNMALVKKKRGQLLSSVRFCNMYLAHDPSNYHIRNVLSEIQNLVLHDS